MDKIIEKIGDNMAKKILKVMIPCRDRSILTKKCIESIHENTKRFDEIQIYCFDNLSSLESGRFSMFENLLKRNLISFYSYDTMNSLNDCFGKSVAYKRWLDMINNDLKVNATVKIKDREHYYMLLDNDMIVCPKWDDYFISALSGEKPTTYFLVKYPGGTSKQKNLEKKTKVKNVFNSKEEIDIQYGLGGGGSGFWFMNESMMKKQLCRWTSIEVAQTHKLYKRHDSTMWRSIIKTTGVGSSYFIRVIAPDPKYPLVLHLGSVFGSMCNSLMKEQYKREQIKFEADEQQLKNLDVSQIIEKFNKDKCRSW